MKYLLDTNIVSKLYDRSAEGHLRIREKIASLSEPDELAISVLTLYELGYGLANAPEDKRDVVLQKVDQVQEDFRLLPLPSEGAPIFGKLKKALKEKRSLTREGAQKHSVDLLLATTCLVGNWTLVTADAIFEDLRTCEPQLVVDDWLDLPAS